MNRVKIFYLISLLILAGCGTKGNVVKYKVPDLGGLYDDSAKTSDLYRNPVIVIPGILGSKLVDGESGRIAWGAFQDDYANPEKPDGARIIALPINEGVPLSELKDEVYSDGALDRVKVKVLGLPISLNAYMNILATLGVGGYRDQTLGIKNAIDYGDEHFTCYQYDYDWRRDNVESAKLLNDFILEKRAYIQEEFKKRYGVENHPVKFDIVAHSMGGLVTRYFLRYGGADLPEDGSLPDVTWEGATYVDKVIMVGPPNSGAVGAIHDLVDGKPIGPFLPTYPPAVIGTMPSLYQLMSRSRHGAIRDETGTKLDIMDPELWIKMNWGLADSGQDSVLEHLLPDVSDPDERRRIALDHLKKSLARAEQFQQALDVPAEPPEGLKLYLIAGDAAPTGAVITVDTGTGDIEVTQDLPGDGTVPRYSALMDERTGNEWKPRLVTPIKWSHVMFLFTDHLGLTKDPAFADNVLFLLLEQPTS